MQKHNSVKACCGATENVVAFAPYVVAIVELHEMAKRDSLLGVSEILEAAEMAIVREIIGVIVNGHAPSESESKAIATIVGKMCRVPAKSLLAMLEGGSKPCQPV